MYVSAYVEECVHVRTVHYGMYVQLCTYHVCVHVRVTVYSVAGTHVHVRVTVYNVASTCACKGDSVQCCWSGMHVYVHYGLSPHTYIRIEPMYIYGCTYIHTCIRSYRCIVLCMKMYGHYGL